MTDKTRIRIAAGATALFLAGISAAGLAVHASGPSTPSTPATPAAPALASQPPQAAPSFRATGVEADDHADQGYDDEEAWDD